MSTLKQDRRTNPIQSLVSGGFGGVCNVLVGHPLDTIKVRLQTMPTPLPGEEPKYRGTFDCAAKTIRHEGVLGLYKGMSAPLIGVVPIFALCFASYSFGKRLFQTSDSAKLQHHQIFAAGAFSGIVTTVITAPGERIKCLLQVQQASGGERKYNGFMDCGLKIYKEGGIRGIYRGACATLLRDMPANGTYFMVYEYLKSLATSGTDRNEISMVWSLIAGGLAGISFWLVGMPPDILKSRLQTAAPGTYKHGVRSVFRDLMAKDGPMALYRGVTPVMIRAFPANAACFCGIELANRAIERLS